MKTALSFVLLAVPVILAATPTSAQTWTSHRYDPPASYGTGHDPGYGRRHDSYGRGYDFNGQADVPGDYRCDAFWDRGRDDCDAAWRDQRPFGGRNDRTQGRYGYSGGYPGYSMGSYGYPTRSRGYGRGYDSRYGRTQGTAYYGAYGRPDLVYPDSGYRGGHGGGYAGGRDPGRIDWCRATYRSYDSHSGYYRAYSGRLVFCG